MWGVSCGLWVAGCGLRVAKGKKLWVNVLLFILFYEDFISGRSGILFANQPIYHFAILLFLHFQPLFL
ncbi:hypothetical protein ACM46_18660 [Chryseobacterium angstadtii]|uniref:Uncharacterized protein n=1 Tax=Chryseobacterium angstadtii TaxID=558151 RepID=A0A0J7I2Q8_9FLAO|nr:hypothetical protein ACM46_18660 [Chryseobacterium angstadtii]